MPDPILSSSSTPETPSTTNVELTTSLNAVIAESTAKFEAAFAAQLQAISAESAASNAEFKAKMDAITTKASIDIEELTRQLNVPDPNLTASSSSLSSGLTRVETETRSFLTLVQQKPLLYTTDRNGSLQPVSPSFWGGLLRLRRAFDEAATAIEFKSPKGPQ